MQLQLQNIQILTADLILESGLHIGAGDSEIHIGGIDNSVVKHPISGEPYIPGSSLKGKIRSLLEWKSGAVQDAPLGHDDYKRAEEAGDVAQQTAVKHILQLFGISGDTGNSEEGKKFQQKIGHTRLAFWDCPLDPAYAQEQRDNDRLYTEAKSENSINRISGTAEHPRQTERVPAGAKFRFKLTLKTFDGDDATLRQTLLTGLKLLEWDSLGGSGSRGYGKVRFDNLELDGKNISDEFAQLKPFG